MTFQVDKGGEPDHVLKRWTKGVFPFLVVGRQELQAAYIQTSSRDEPAVPDSSFVSGHIAPSSARYRRSEVASDVEEQHFTLRRQLT